MAGYPRSDIEADNWQTIAPDDWSWLDHVKAYGSDAGNALLNLGSNLVEGVSPFAPTATQYGKPSLQVPPMLHGIADSYSRLAGTPSQPGNAYNLTGVKELDAPIQQDMSNVLLSLYGGNAMAGVSKPAGSVGMFAGRNAKTADLNALAKAEQLAGQGATRDAIWNETGWFQGPDQKWRFEIDDSGSGISKFKSQNGPLSSILEHDNLALAYPDVASIPVEYKRNQGIGSGGYDSGGYQFSNGAVAPEGISIEAPYRNQGQFSGRSIGLHEAQHAVQNREGFTPGSSPINFTSIGVNRKMAFDNPGVDLYRKVAGEVEARNVQKRMDMTPEQRKATPPWLTQDVPFEDQIVSFYSDTGKPSLFGSALATAGEQPKGALGAGAMREAEAQPIRAYHGTPEANSFSPRQRTMWATDSPELASSYALDKYSQNESPGVVPVDLSFKNPLVVDGGGAPWLNVPFEGSNISTDAIASIGFDRGHDGLIIRNIDDDMSGSGRTGNVYSALRPNTVRSATTGETLFSDNKPSLFGSALATAGEQRAKPVLSGGPLDFVKSDASYGGLLANQAVDHIANLANIPAHYMDGRSMGASIPSAAADTINTLMASKNALNTEYALKRKAIEEGGKTPFQYSIETPEGDFMGSANGTVVGDTMFLDWLGGRTPNSIGVSGVKALREQVRSDFPNVKKFQGTRISGARDKANATDRTQTVILKSDVFGLPQAQQQDDFDINEFLMRYSAQ